MPQQAYACQYCLTPFNARQGALRYCSAICRRAAEAEAKLVPPVAIHDCLYCQQPFYTVTGNHNRRVCSEDCRRQRNNASGRTRYDPAKERTKRYAARTCTVCDASYSPRNYKSTTCSPVCSWIARGYATSSEVRTHIPTVTGGPCSPLRARPTTSHSVGGTCQECGTPYVSRGLWTVHYCSPLCGRRAARSQRKHRRRAAQGTNRVYRRKVYDRDSWTCRLCGKPIDRDALAPDPLAATMDHIVPIALGGQHEMTNVQTAHFICNSRKGSRVTQLAFAA